MNSEEHAALAILAGNKVCLGCGFVDDPLAIMVWVDEVCWQCAWDAGEHESRYEERYAEREERVEYQREAEQWRR